MNTTITISAVGETQQWLSGYQSKQRLAAELDWLTELREQALAQFAELGLPPLRHEDWRYCNLKQLCKQSLVLVNATAQPDEPTLREADNCFMDFADGQVTEQGLSNRAGKSGIFASLKTVLAEQPDVLRDYFNRTQSGQPHGFNLLNTAFCENGFVAISNNNSSIDDVLNIHFQHASAATARHYRNVIVAKTNSRLTVIERHQGASNGLVNSITEMIAEPGAQIDHYKIIKDVPAAHHIGAVQIHQQKDSSVKTHSFCVACGVLRNDVTGDLNAPGADLEMNGLVIGSQQMHVDNFTCVNHLQPHCTSDEFYKSILDDESRSVFRGRIVVAQDAQQTRADQQNNNLLLSPRAEANSKPQLEIHADDVQCSHGATVGQLDEKSLFYLMSRGINRAQAKTLLTFAFANEVIERVKVQPLREELTSRLAGQVLDDLPGDES